MEMEEQMIAHVIDAEEDIAMLFEDDDFNDDDSKGVEEEEPPSVYEVGGPSTVVAEGPTFLLSAPGLPVPPSVINVTIRHFSVRLEEGSRTKVRDVGLPPRVLNPPRSVPLPDIGVTIEDLGTRLGNLEYEHGQLVKKVIQVSDAEVAAGVSIREIGPRVFAIEGQVQALQVAVRQRDTQTQQLQTMVSKMSSHESTPMQCILGMDRRLTTLERRPPGPQ
nr:hypothetical protein [Tanacetum cinerariifolium]